ncbi:hypothetical protein CFP56_015369 [Quercus suber]|uniref:BRO1 domain-containing protein n=1 Tax=Quercus suber TaxID=58331 RepID=A0AAW0KST2_QUESU
MGCLVSTPNDSGGKNPKNVGEIMVFVPGLRIPKPVDFVLPLNDGLSKNLVERLSALRTRIVVMAGQEAPRSAKSRRTATQHGGSTLADLQQALEDYLPVLLGLVYNGNKLQHKLQFCWVNQEDDAEETTMSNSSYEVLSVLHLMAMLTLSQANFLLLSKASTDGYQSKVSEECRRTSIDLLLKAAGYLDFAVKHALPQFPPEDRKDLPLDLAEEVLEALCLQALGQVVDIQLGMAIDSIQATMAVKRRLACEMVKYWHQAQENIVNLPLANRWGEKHKLFVKWKHNEAKAAAYYYHGLILDEGKTERFHIMAVAALQAADQNPPVWRTSSKYLSEKIATDIASKVQMERDTLNHELIEQTAPALPDFALSLKPDEYNLPSVDPSWNDILQSESLFPSRQDAI